MDKKQNNKVRVMC